MKNYVQFLINILIVINTLMVEAQNFSSGGSSHQGGLHFSPSRYTSPSIEHMIRKQVCDIRDRIYNYKVLEIHSGETKKKGLKSEKIPDHADIILFGPSGSGKSSLIRTFYRSLNETQRLSEKVEASLSIKEKDQNEGTTQFTGVLIKKRTKVMTLEEKKTFRLKQNQSINNDSDLDPVSLATPKSKK